MTFRVPHPHARIQALTPRTISILMAAEPAPTETSMESTFDRFAGTVRYITSPALRHAVNVAAAIKRPLLVKGEPGTGKTLLATAIAEDLGLELAGHRQAALLAEEVLRPVDLAVRPARRLLGVERAHLEHGPRAFAVGGGQDGRVAHHEASVAEELMDREGHLGAHTEDGAEGVGARPQMRQLAQAFK